MKGEGQSFTATMTQTGRIPYICTIHQSALADMDGVINVVAATGPSPAAGLSPDAGPAASPTASSPAPLPSSLPATGHGAIAAIVGLALGMAGAGARAAAKALRATGR
jgi:hypothetical protein